jgi:hypothetical protein
MNNFCMTCGKPLVTGTRFCGTCGAGIAESSSSVAPVPSVAPVSSVAATSESVRVRKPISTWQGFLIAIGLFLPILCLGYFGGESVMPFVGLALLITVVWACIDSYQIRRQYGTKNTTAHPAALLFMLVGLWIVIFPIYLVTRSRVLASDPRTPPPPSETEIRKRPLRVAVIAACVVGFVVLGSGALYVSSGSSIKGVWQTTDAQLAAANAAAGTRTPQTSTGAAVPPIAVSQEVSEPVPFDSVDALLKDDGRVRGKVISVKTKVSSVGEDEIAFETGEEWFNWRVTCQFSTEQQMTLQTLKEGQDLTITGTVPAEGHTELRAATPEQAGLYQLKLSGCRIP